jgi:internalin A
MARDEAYRIAEQEIEQALRSGAKELDLSGKYSEKKPRLTELPESLRQLRQLETLNLSNNRLTAMPEWLGQLTQLQSLDLYLLQLKLLPESLGQLTQLQ